MKQFGFSLLLLPFFAQTAIASPASVLDITVRDPVAFNCTKRDERKCFRSQILFSNSGNQATYFSFIDRDWPSAILSTSGICKGRLQGDYNSMSGAWDALRRKWSIESSIELQPNEKFTVVVEYECDVNVKPGDEALIQFPTYVSTGSDTPLLRRIRANKMPIK
jgi:hypothetical protein